MRSSEEALIATIAGLRTRAKNVTLPVKSLILKTRGPEALLDEVFGLGLLDPRKEAALAEAAADLHNWQSTGYEIIPIYDERYPQQLWQVHEAPGLIFSSGTVQPDDRAVSVVGSRNADAAALQAARDVCQQLASHGITVVSGYFETIFPSLVFMGRGPIVHTSQRVSLIIFFPIVRSCSSVITGIAHR